VDDVQELVYAKRDWVHGTKDFFRNAVRELRTGMECRLGLEPEQITRSNFIKLLKAKHNVKFLEENGVDLCFMKDSHLGELFDLMDDNDNGALDVEEFVGCLYSLKGPARALDLKLEHKRTIQQLSSMQDKMKDLTQNESRRDSKRQTNIRIDSKKSAAVVNEFVG
jgi:hypothetical protein